MISTTNFIIIKDKDLAEGMPTHFTSRYGKLNPETGRMNKRSWQEYIDDPSVYEGGTPKIIIDGIPCSVVSIVLSPIDGDYSYEAAFEYGQELEAPFGQCCNLKQANELISKYTPNIN